MMQYRHLHYFVSVVEAGSFSRAASTIHVAQPALSQQIAQLEEQLGVSLLLRSARGVRPTAAGDVLYREASSILKRLQQLPGIVRSGTGVAKGTVRLGMSSTFVTTAPAAFMEQYKASLPNVVLRMAVSDSPTIKRRVTAHELDLGLVLEDELAPNFARLPLFRQRLFLIRHHAASKGKPVQLADLASLPLILPPSPNITRTALDRALAKAKLSPNVVMEADVVANIIAAVRADVGGVGTAKGRSFRHVGRRSRRTGGDRAAGLSYLFNHLVRQFSSGRCGRGRARSVEPIRRDYLAPNAGAWCRMDQRQVNRIVERPP